MYSFNNSESDDYDEQICQDHHKEIIKICLQENCNRHRLCRICIDSHDSTHQEINPYELWQQVKKIGLAPIQRNNKLFQDLFFRINELKQDIVSTIDKLLTQAQEMKELLPINPMDEQVDKLKSINETNLLENIEILRNLYLSKDKYKNQQLKIIQREEKLSSEIKKVLGELQQMKYCVQDIYIQDFASRKNSEIEEPLNLVAVLSGHDNVVRSIIRLHDDDFATGSRDKTIRIWSSQDYRCKQIIREHCNWVQDLLKINDKFCSCSDDKSIKIYEKFEKWACVKTLLGHECYVMRVIFNEEHQTLISCSTDSTVRVWKQDLVLKHNNSVYSIASIGNIIVSGDENGDIIMWNIEGPQLYSKQGHKGCVNSLVITDHIYSSGDDKQIKLWSMDLQFISKIYQSQYEIEALLVLGDIIIAGDQDGGLIMIQDKKSICELKAHKDRIYKLSYSNVIITASSDGTAKIYEMNL
ncbi:hypothetical protein pb186bvf_007914 [Paramecium bursaria]